MTIALRPRTVRLVTDESKPAGASTTTGSHALVRGRRKRRRMSTGVLSALLGWLAYAIALGVVGVGWWVGKPLTPELLAILGAFLAWGARTDVAVVRRLRGHERALQEIAEHRGVSPDHVASVYDVVDDAIAQEQRQERARPRRRR